MKRVLYFSACCASALVFPAVGYNAWAQLNNKPFSFNTPSGGVGMSVGGKQAILNKELFNMKPDNMLRDINGSLLSVTEGRGNTAIVNYEGGSVIPSYRGTSYKGDNSSWSAGVFNTFFMSNNESLSGFPTYAQMQTGAAISTWTSRVTTGMPVSYMPSNSVDMWTSMVAQASYNSR